MVGEQLRARLNKTFTETFAGKKIIIYGAGNSCRLLIILLNLVNIKADYAVDIDVNKHGYNNDLQMHVKHPADLLYENLDDLLVLVSVPDSSGIEAYLTDIGFTRDKNYILYSEYLKTYRVCDYFDPLLGFNRIDDIKGFKIYGESTVNSNKIVTLGGSTTDYSTYWIRSWPDYFFWSARQKGHDISLYNGAISGYNSSQDLLKLLRDVLSLQPNVVINLSGFNDIYRLSGSDMLTIPYLQQLYPILIQNWDEHHQKSGIKTLPPEKSNISNAEIWVSNIRAMNAICSEYDIKFFAFLQPTLATYSGEIPNSIYDLRKLWKTELSYQKDFYDSARMRIDKLKHVYDLTDALDGHSDVYIDCVHYTEKGNSLLADKIYGILAAGGTL